MNLHRFIFILCCVVALISAPLSKAVEPPTRTEVRFMSWELDQTGLLTTENGKDYTPISAPAYDFGASTSIRSDAPLRLYRQTVGKDGPVYTLVGQAALPPGCRIAQVYLVRQSEKLTPQDYNVIVMSNDPSVFAAGSVRVFNFSPFEAAVKVGPDSIRLRPLEWKNMTAAPDRKNRVLIFAALQLTENEWTPTTRDMVTIRENYRGSVTLLHTRIRFDEVGPLPLAPAPRMLIRSSTEVLNPPVLTVTSLRKR